MPVFLNTRFVRCISRQAISLLIVIWLAAALAAAEPNGSQIYQQQCASCHGSKGEGTIESYPHPLVGERSVGELAAYISKTMPEDKPGTCVGEDARKVSQFIFETFYSPTAQARNKPVRVELSRLTVRQYQNAVADLIGSFRGAGKLDNQEGLRGEYFKSRRPNGKDRAIERIDPVVAFDFADKSPDAEKVEPHEFSIRWEGAVMAPDSGEYEFLVRTDQAVRLWINDLNQPLIDAYVKSGSDTEHRASLPLLAGRTYALKLEFSKAKQGVDDKKAKEKPPAPASISLLWKRPHRVDEVIASRYLSPSRPSEAFVVMTKFPPDDRSVGWEKATSISKEWDQATTDAAIEIATFVASRFEQFAGTKRDAADRDAKLKEFCRRFTERAFRRPLSDEQRQMFVDRHFSEGVDPETAVKRAILLTLKSPRFLYREVGSSAVPRPLGSGQPDQANQRGPLPDGRGTDVVDGFDTASRISFAMYDSLPDQALLDAAAKGELKTREQAVQHATRLLADPRTRAKLREFLLTWLKVEHVPDVSKDSERFPEFNAVLANDLRTSLELSLDELLKSDDTDFRQLLLTDSIYLSGRLARFYGAKMSDGEPAEDAPFQKVELEPEQRAGVLSHPYLMAGFAYTGSSSPIHRGIFIARSVLGRSLRPPPEAVAPLSPQLRPDLTTRERVALQTKPEACQSCHAMINPLGFTLEHFDAVGRFRKEDNGKPVNATGAYRTRNGETVQFTGVNDLAKFLAESPETHAAFVEQLFHFLVKQPIRAFGSNTRETLRAAFVQDKFNIRRLMVEIIATSAMTGAPSVLVKLSDTTQLREFDQMIEALANTRTKAPRIIEGNFDEFPLWGDDFDGNEQRRVRQALLDLNNQVGDELWPFLLKHVGDKRYAYTFDADTFAKNSTVGSLCFGLAEDDLLLPFMSCIPKEDLGNNYRRYPKSDWRPFASQDLPKWAGQRSGKKLHELQVEICEQAIQQAPVMEKLTDAERKKFVEELTAQIAKIKQTKEPIVYKTRFRGEYYSPFVATSRTRRLLEENERKNTGKK